MPNYAGFKKKIVAVLKEKLNSKLSYHGFHHVENVMNAALMLAKEAQLPPQQVLLLETAVLLHDSGFITTYAGHEEESVLIARQMLPEFGYEGEDIELIAGMIRATKIPQQPHTEMEEIIADADLEYLGTERFDEISESLYRELKAYNFISSREEWNNIQVDFLSKHTYFTEFCKKNREPVKRKHIEQIKGLLNGS